MDKEKVIKIIEKILKNLDGVCSNKLKAEAIFIELEKLLKEE